MLHLRNTLHQDSEATVIKANRKHQIVFNMEVKRIEMEKKMRERYFCFEMSLMKARRLKIVDRQKSLGIYRPHTMENAGIDPRKGGRAKSFFFTQSVAMDSKVKLPPVLDRRRAFPGFPKLVNKEDSRKINKLSKNIAQNNNIFEKERAKRFPATGKMGTYQGGKDQSKTHSKMIPASWKFNQIDEGNLEKNSKLKNGVLCRSVENLNDVLIVQKDQSSLKLGGKNFAVEKEGVKEDKNADINEGKLSEENRKGNEHGDSNCKHSEKDLPEENDVTGTFNSQPSPQKLIGTETISAQTSKIIDLPSYQELQAWRKSLEARVLNYGKAKHLNGTSRLKSASLTGYRKGIDLHEACAVNTRPQSALARLLKDERESS